MARLVELLDYLHVTTEEVTPLDGWFSLLLGTIQTSEGAQLLSHWYWELLVDLAIRCSAWFTRDVTYNPQIMTFLAEAQEWSKLECWMGAIWVFRPLEADGITEEDLERSTLLLFRQRPGAFEKLEQWMERWSEEIGKDTPELFQRICKQAQEAVQRDTP